MFKCKNECEELTIAKDAIVRYFQKRNYFTQEIITRFENATYIVTNKCTKVKVKVDKVVNNKKIKIRKKVEVGNAAYVPEIIEDTLIDIVIVNTCDTNSKFSAVLSKKINTIALIHEMLHMISSNLVDGILNCGFSKVISGKKTNLAITEGMTQLLAEEIYKEYFGEEWNTITYADYSGNKEYLGAYFTLKMTLKSIHDVIAAKDITFMYIHNDDLAYEETLKEKQIDLQTLNTKLTKLSFDLDVELCYDDITNRLKEKVYDDSHTFIEELISKLNSTDSINKYFNVQAFEQVINIK